MRAVAPHVTTRLGFLIRQTLRAVCDRPAFAIVASVPACAVAIVYVAAPDNYRADVAGPLLREAATFAGTFGVLVIGWVTYLAAAEIARGTEELDVSLGVTFWKRHLASSVVAAFAAGAAFLGVLLATWAMGLCFDHAFAPRAYLRWSVAFAAVLPASLALVQTFAVIVKAWRQPVGCSLAGVVLTAAAWNMGTLVTMDPTRLLGLFVSGLVPDVEWLQGLLLAYAYGANDASWATWAWAFCGFSAQCLLLSAVVRWGPLSSEHAETRTRVLSQNRL